MTMWNTPESYLDYLLENGAMAKETELLVEGSQIEQAKKDDTLVTKMVLMSSYIGFPYDITNRRRIFGL